MTRIDFYTGVDDKARLAHSIAGKVLARDQHLVIALADEAALTALDKALWTLGATSFVPHCRADDALAGRTPILLTCADDPPPNGDQVLLNLRPDPPAFFSRFDRLLEFVGTDSDDIERSRQRFRFYRDRGYEITTHKLDERGAQSQ